MENSEGILWRILRGFCGETQDDSVEHPERFLWRISKVFSGA